MTTSSKHMKRGAARIEVGVIEHEGREFAALGSLVDHASGVVVGYVSQDGTTLQTLDGQPIARLVPTGSWRMPHRYAFASRPRVESYRAVIDGHRYHGRGSGPGMVLTMRKSKRSR